MCTPGVLQDRIGSIAQQRKEDQAEYDRVQEERRERLASLAQDAQDAKLVRQAATLLLGTCPAEPASKEDKQFLHMRPAPRCTATRRSAASDPTHMVTRDVASRLVCRGMRGMWS